MLYLIDGHNLIPFVKGLDLKQIDDEMRLLNILQDYARQNRANVEVFFDGAAPGWAGEKRFGGIIAHFVKKGKTADEAIRQRLTRLPAGSGVVVVSSDRQVQAEARNHRAEILPSGVFASNLIIQKPEPQKRKRNTEIELNDSEIDEWLKLFGDDTQQD